MLFTPFDFWMVGVNAAMDAYWKMGFAPWNAWMDVCNVYLPSPRRHHDYC